MNWNSRLRIIAVALTIISCSGVKNKESNTALSADEKEEQLLLEEVIAVHDEVMPEMGTLMQLSNTLMSKADSLLLLDSVNQVVNSANLKELSLKVELANESMMEWMRKFEQPADSVSHGQVMQYLQEQKTSIQKVKELMLISKADAEKAISTL